MPLSRRLKRTLSWLVAVCLLFAQTAAAAFACPRDVTVLASEAIAETPCAQHLSAGGQSGPAAEGLVATANVCEVHCQAASLPDSGTLDVPPMTVAVSWERSPLVPGRGVRAPAPDVEARSAAPPPLALLPRLLI